MRSSLGSSPHDHELIIATLITVWEADLQG